MKTWFLQLSILFCAFLCVAPLRAEENESSLDAYLAEKHEVVRARRAVAAPVHASIGAEQETELFSDAAFHALEKTGVDVQDLKEKLRKKDYKGAKEILNQPSEESRTEEEEEVFQMAEERVKTSKVKNTQPATVEENPAPRIFEEKVVFDEKQALVPSVLVAADVPTPTAAQYDLMKLKENGVRKLVPGMSIFRFAHHRFSEWESKKD